MREIRIESDGTAAGGTKIFDLKTGVQIDCTRIRWVLDAGVGVAEAEVDLVAVQLDGKAMARFFLDYVRDGMRHYREIKSVTFADGETVEF